jgi:hypothetical protein
MDFDLCQDLKSEYLKEFRDFSRSLSRDSGKEGANFVVFAESWREI